MPNVRDKSLPRAKPGDELPAPGTKRWTPRRKASVVEAVRSGLIAIDEACRSYDLTAEEFISWRNAMQNHGMRALYATALQGYRNARPKEG